MFKTHVLHNHLDNLQFTTSFSSDTPSSPFFPSVVPDTVPSRPNAPFSFPSKIKVDVTFKVQPPSVLTSEDTKTMRFIPKQTFQIDGVTTFPELQEKIVEGVKMETDKYIQKKRRR